MLDFSIAQALFDGTLLRAKSDNFTDAFQAEAERIVAAYGTPPTGVQCADAIFALPFGPKHALVAQVAGPPLYSGLRFHLLVVGKVLYGHLHDPFLIAERFPPTWDERGELPALEWPPDAGPPHRTIAQLEDVLKQNGPFFLGASQTLVDGARIALEAPEPQTQRIRDLWKLLPASTRRACWPATYAFSAEPGFDLLVMPKIPEGGIAGYLNEEQTYDYPDARYERSLQMAVESGDQRELDKLLARRSGPETLKLALVLLLGIAIFSILMKLAQ